MNKEYLLIICIIIAITYVCIIKAIKKEKQNKIKEKNSKLLNKEDATLFEIQESYKYETGKSYKDVKNDKGLSLEYKTFEVIYKLGGKVLSDLFIPKSKDETTQTDIIFIHNTGIYVIEAKNIKAKLIKGDDDDGVWEIFYNDKILPLYSPLKQNIKHVDILKQFLNNYENINIYYKSIVVLGIDRDKIKVKFNQNQDGIEQDIVSINNLEQYMKDLIYKRKEDSNNEYELLDDSLVLEIYNIIHEKCSDVDEDIKTKHALDNNY